ncbi:uncharacterized protein LOC133838119 [Drosophila sulfurigaster albostrigata]|uniref:uncharacterized protein LOC133838119 n=1 Tax=Drosophila sulfurigaster albostrigata TaxID=89887 RepID=UPI002D21BA65|nr:uncharacterized protein LOC133838119 [Drosophila sulfurigaster albostrigata]XP_062125078.1 uncharacterized protein LOC133838119 [Drosophila sulfurigaster albostrigata]XP_062125080.1 uncharacterized protein LOC133838119 [Drosophila sulfurigaster albostrigata]
MSCQQASRFITTTTAAATVTATTAKSTAAATKRIATQQSLATAAAATTTATTITVGAKLAAKTTPTVTLLDGESVGVVAAGKTNTPEDPYVFTETVAATPPILFNAQKSRARLNEAQHNSRNNNNNGSSRQTVAGKKSSIVGATAASIAQLNGTATATTTAATARATAATAVATAKAQASSAVTTAAAAATTTTNFNNVTQSQRQPTSQSQSQLQLQLQSTLQLQPQASPKRATNVCVVRPQQQQMQQQQQQQQLKQQQAKLTTKHHAPHPPPPPPLYTHTPSLWQTPLLLDTTQQKQQQPQQTNLVVATALVSPPISPASLPSPTANASPPTAAVTAMVSPIVLPPATAVVAAAVGAMSPPKGASLPPSKFHHTTLAQHLQKVECLKKKKSLPLACQNSNNNNNNIIVETLQKRQTFGGYNLTHPPPLTAFNSNSAATTTTITTPTVVGEKKHSAEAVDDNSSDLNEIPVNVIFRKPPGPVLLPGPATQQTPPHPGAATDAKIAAQTAMMKLGAVTPLTPPTPPSPANASAMSAPLLLPSLGGVTVAAAAAQPAPPPTTSAAAAAVQNEQMSSKVANSAPKRRAPAANAGCRKGNKASVKTTEVPLSLPQPLPLAAVQQPEELQPPAEPASRRRKQPATANKRQAVGLISENEPLPLDDVPYCLQTRWLHDGSGKDLALDATQSVCQQGNRDREERIAVRKGLLRRQALQLLSTRPLQELPMRAARQRLQGIQTLLVKYQDHANQQQGIGIGNRCLVNGCKQPTLSMAAHCESHIVNNSTQKLFQPCVAWRVNGSACQAPVFDMLHTLALCSAHSHLRPGLEQQSRQQLPQQPKADKVLVQQLTRPPPTPAVPGPAPAYALTAAAATAAATAGKRKRKTNPNANPVGRPLKRAKKQPDATTTTTGAGTTVNNAPATLPTVMSMTSLPPMSAVMQRKSSTTSLESIASNSQSSAKSHSALQPYTPTVPVLTMPQLSIIPPALAPLSDYQQQQLAKLEPEHQQQQQQLDANLLANANFKADEISQIVAQLAAAGNELHHNNNNNNNLHYNNNMSYCSNNNSNSGSSSISCGFPSFNAAFGNAMGTGAGQGHQHQHQHQQMATSLHANTSLASTESLLSQQIFGICENSSAYASSEDTGLGGLSESELIGANDADDIALNGAHLLEEHDLVNVFDTLPEDAFNELFQSVQQDECEAMDRALEIADKNLKCLQQTIGGTAHDSAFLNDFLDVGDDLLVNAVMNSPNTSGIDTSTLFVDSSGSGSGISSTNGPAGSSSAASVADIRGLVHI